MRRRAQAFAPLIFAAASLPTRVLARADSPDRVAAGRRHSQNAEIGCRCHECSPEFKKRLPRSSPDRRPFFT